MDMQFSRCKLRMTGRFRLRKHPIRVALGTLAIVLVSLTYVPAAWHGEHAADKDYNVCKLGNQPMAKCWSALELGPANPHDPAAPAARIVLPGECHLVRSLGRAPPAWFLSRSRSVNLRGRLSLTRRV